MLPSQTHMYSVKYNGFPRPVISNYNVFVLVKLNSDGLKTTEANDVYFLNMHAVSVINWNDSHNITEIGSSTWEVYQLSFVSQGSRR